MIDMIDIYCPACGTWQLTREIDTIQPGDIEWTCPDCKTEFVITIGFFEKAVQNT